MTPLESEIVNIFWPHLRTVESWDPDSPVRAKLDQLAELISEVCAEDYLAGYDAGYDDGYSECDWESE